MSDVSQTEHKFKCSHYSLVVEIIVSLIYWFIHYSMLFPGRYSQQSLSVIDLLYFYFPLPCITLVYCCDKKK